MLPMSWECYRRQKVIRAAHDRFRGFEEENPPDDLAVFGAAPACACSGSLVFAGKVEGVIGKTGLDKDKFLRYNTIKNRSY